MRKILLSLLVSTSISLFAATPQGALSGRFTINNDGDQIVFSQGNLQFNTIDSVWSFAEHQYDTICRANSTTGVMDLFSWGTGDNPTLISSKSGAYTTFTDWGVNPISNGGNEANLWRSLTGSEWQYLLLMRDNADNLFGLGSVNGVKGLIIMPDGWTGKGFHPSTQKGLQLQGLDYINTNEDNFSHNTYTLSQWAAMEEQGAVFLPAAGARKISTKGKISYSSINYEGNYWTGKPDKNKPCEMCFSDRFLQSIANDRYAKSTGMSVRLVQTAPALVLDTMKCVLQGKFTINGNGDQIKFSQGNLQYDAVNSIWLFAEHQYDTIGIANSTTGMMDLFGWGTGDNPTLASSDNADYATFNDWGNNIISNGGNMGKIWHTLTESEWLYLLKFRANASELCSQATVNGVHGCILLPDDWTTPDGLSFTPYSNDWKTNKYDMVQWTQMEANGAVFLPTAGYRGHLSGSGGFNSEGNYWSATPRQALPKDAHYFRFYECGVYVSSISRDFGHSVRLVMTVPREVSAEDSVAIVDKKDGVLKGKFSINADGDQIRFSQGNLQYDTVNHVWSFGEKQSYSVGYRNVPKIDLFGWGTGNNPTLMDYENTEYTEFVDWGVNPISNGGNEANLWRTLTIDEWDYILNKRNNASNLCSKAYVDDMRGYILLPDDWETPFGLQFTAQADYSYINDYDSLSWSVMEANGAVFLLDAGFRSPGYNVSQIGSNGYYWSSTPDKSDNAHNIAFDESAVGKYTNVRKHCFSVRLVQDCPKAITTSVENVQTENVQSAKVIRNGQLYIIHNDKTYTVDGRLVR